MTRSVMTILVVLVAAATASGQSSTEREEAAIRRQLEAYSQARQNGNGRAQSLFYTVDAETWLSTTHTISRGRAAIAQELDRPPDPTRRFRLEIDSLSFAAENVALVEARYFGQSTEASGHALYVIVKHDGAWLIRAAHIARLAAPNP